MRPDVQANYHVVMTDEEIMELRFQRDTAKVRAAELERENARLRMLLGYAEAAIRDEYQLRVQPGADA